MSSKYVKVENLLQRVIISNSVLKELWDGISNFLGTTAYETIGFQKGYKKTAGMLRTAVLQWRESHIAYFTTLRSTNKRAGWVRYRGLKRKTRGLYS